MGARDDTKRGLCHICGESQLIIDLRRDQGKMACSACLSRRGHSAKNESSSKYKRSTDDTWSSPRRNERVDVDQAYVRLARPGGIFGLFRGNAHIGRALDLSLTGAQCLTELDVKKGDAVQVELRLPGSAEPLVAAGAVRWIAPGRGTGQRVGIEFVEMDFLVRKQLEIYVQTQSSTVFRRNEERADPWAPGGTTESIPLPEHLQEKVRAHREAKAASGEHDIRGVEPSNTRVLRKDKLPPDAPESPPLTPPVPGTPRTRRGSATRHIGKRDTREDFDF